MPGSKKLLKSISSARNSNICSKCKAIFREAEEQSNIWLPAQCPQNHLSGDPGSLIYDCLMRSAGQNNQILRNTKTLLPVFIVSCV